MLRMQNAPFVKCAAPECASAARFGNACTYHSSPTYDRASWRQQPFAVIAVDPASEHVCIRVDVRAISADEAKRAARAELALAKRDDWSIRFVSAA